MRNYVLFFIEGSVPTTQEFAKAEKFMNRGPVLRFIPVGSIGENDALIDNVGVAGSVPEKYKDFPRVDRPTKKAEDESPKAE